MGTHGMARYLGNNLVRDVAKFEGNAAIPGTDNKVDIRLCQLGLFD